MTVIMQEINSFDNKSYGKYKKHEAWHIYKFYENALKTSYISFVFASVKRKKGQQQEFHGSMVSISKAGVSP